MKTSDALKRVAIRTIEVEAAAIKNLSKSINADFLQCVEHIIQSKGRVVVTGIGKSAIIGQKIVASLNSTGTPSCLLYTSDAADE